jgi:ELWxxDGT repeat protein
MKQPMVTFIIRSGLALFLALLLPLTMPPASRAALPVYAPPVIVKDISSYSSNPSYLVNLNGSLLFSADEPTHKTELWKSDGTATGTVMVKDLWTSGGSSEPSYLTVFKNQVFFAASDGDMSTTVHGEELWKSDGTTAGTILVRDISPGDGSSYPNSLTVMVDLLFFAAANGLWVTDGSEAGTIELRANCIPYWLKVSGNLLFFGGNDQTTGGELWKSDGTIDGTILVKDINPGTGSSMPHALADLNGVLYFAAGDADGTELWKSDGTEAGTVQVKDIIPGPNGSNPDFMTNINNVLYFNTYGGIWKSDGSESGTVLVKYISGQSFVGMGNWVYFIGDDGLDKWELWKTDGSENGTTMVKDINLGGNAFPGTKTLVVAENRIFFEADNGVLGRELWISNGTEADTVLVGDLNPGSASSQPASFTLINDTLFFAATHNTFGRELWALKILKNSLFMPLVIR